MAFLTLDPQHLLDIDFDTFTFPRLQLDTRSSGEELLMVVWSEGRKYLLYDREVPRDRPDIVDAVRLGVQRFNEDPISGWRELFAAASDAEQASIEAQRTALAERSSALFEARQAAGFACLRARRPVGV